MTRHREKLAVFADRKQHSTLDQLAKTLSRTTTKDNVIDWPLNLAMRAGFNPDKLIGKVINHIAGITNKVQDEWMKNKDLQQAQKSRADSRLLAKAVADFYEKQSELIKAVKANLHSKEDLFNRSHELDKEAHTLYSQISGNTKGLDKLPISLERLKNCAERYHRFLIIKEFASLSSSEPNEKLQQSALKINVSKEGMHIKKVTQELSIPENIVVKNIQDMQGHARKTAFSELAKQYPVLAEYSQLMQVKSKANHLEAEKIDKLMAKLAQKITNDKDFITEIKLKLPNLAKTINAYSELTKHLNLN